MISLRTALEASVNGGDETPLEGEPLVNAVGVNFLSNADYDMIMLGIPDPKFSLDPIAMAMESRTFSRRYRTVAMESFSAGWVVAAVLALFGAVAVLVSWFTGSGSDGGSKGGGGGAMGRIDAKIDSMADQILRNEAYVRLKKLNPDHNLHGSKSQPPEAGLPKMLTAEDTDFAHNRGVSKLVDAGMDHVDAYLDKSNKLLGQAKHFMDTWGDVADNHEIKQFTYTALEAIGVEMDAMFGSMDKIEAQGKSFVDFQADRKAQIQAAREKPDTQAALDVSTMINLCKRTGACVDDYKKIVPDVKHKLEELDKRLAQYTKDQKGYDDRRAAANSSLTERTPEANKLRDELAKIKERLPKIGKYCRASLDVVSMIVQRMNRVIKISDQVDTDGKAYGAWLEKEYGDQLDDTTKETIAEVRGKKK